MKITEYPVVTQLDPDSVFLTDGGGTKVVKNKDLLFNLIDNAAIQHMIFKTGFKRAIVRGKNLGSTFTDEQKAAIADRTFKDLFLGDYWKINEIQWTIVDFNYWAYSGDKNNNIPHVVVMPDNVLYNSKMNDTNTTEGGYANSKMRTSGLDQAKEMIFNAFGEENVLTYRDYLISSVSNGVSSIGNWYDCTVELPNEIMMYGCYIQNPSTNGQNHSNRLTISSSRISLLDLFPNAIQRRANYWLRDVVSGSEFAAFSSTGLPYKYEANISTGVRPIFGLK